MYKQIKRGGIVVLAKRERRKYENDERVWIGKYVNLNNLPHWHYDCEIVFVEQGQALVSVDGKKLFLTAGQGAFINSRRIHYIQAEQDSVLAFLLYDNKLTDGITDKYLLKNPLLNNLQEFAKIYDEISAEFKNKQVFYSQLVNQLVVSFVISIFRSDEAALEENNKQNNNMFWQLLEDVDDKYAFYTFDKAVDFMALSAPYFSKKFHSVFGMTFSQYLNLVRVEKAIELMRNNVDNLSVTEIALLCGFDTIRNFNRVFVSITGYSPRRLPDSYDITVSHQINNSTVFNPTDQRSILLHQR